MFAKYRNSEVMVWLRVDNRGQRRDGGRDKVSDDLYVSSQGTYVECTRTQVLLARSCFFFDTDALLHGQQYPVMRTTGVSSTPLPSLYVKLQPPSSPLRGRGG